MVNRTKSRMWNVSSQTKFASMEWLSFYLPVNNWHKSKDDWWWHKVCLALEHEFWPWNKEKLGVGIRRNIKWGDPLPSTRPSVVGKVKISLNSRYVALLLSYCVLVFGVRNVVTESVLFSFNLSSKIATNLPLSFPEKIS